MCVSDTNVRLTRLRIQNVDHSNLLRIVVDVGLVQGFGACIQMYLVGIVFKYSQDTIIIRREYTLFVVANWLMVRLPRLI